MLYLDSDKFAKKQDHYEKFDKISTSRDSNGQKFYNDGYSGKKSKDRYDGDYRSSSTKDRPIKIEITSSSNDDNGDSTNGDGANFFGTTNDHQPSSTNGFQVPGLDNPYVQRVVDMSKKVITNVEQVKALSKVDFKN